MNRWLLCEYADIGRCPTTAMFHCDENTVGYARAGVAKLNEVMRWSCTYHEFSWHDQYPTVAPTRGDAVMIAAFFEEDKCVVHPGTGELFLPPEAFTAICRAAYEGDVMRAFSRLFRSRGWVGEMESTRVYGG